MDEEKQSQENIFIKVTLLSGLKIIREVKVAYALYFWYVARVTVEWEFRGIKCGGVFGGMPYTDQRIADDLRSYGVACTADQIWRWRNTLIGSRLIACKRTPAGTRTLVLASDKFQAKPGKMPAWAVKTVLAEVVNEA